MLRGLARAATSVGSVRSLGSWTCKFDTARGASLEVRQALGVQLEDVWVLHQDGHEAEAMQAEAGATDGSQIAFALSVEGTAVGFMRAALMNATAGLLIGTQCHSALSMSSVGSPLIHAARNELAARGAKSLMALAPLHGLCEWIVTEKAWERLEKMPGFEPDQLSAVEAVAKGAPRPGQSVLDAETFKAAEPAFK